METKCQVSLWHENPIEILGVYLNPHTCLFHTNANYKIYNFGQGGYGSVQSFLLLKEQISKIKSPKLVIYGLIQHHEYRNVAHAGWLRVLSQYSSRGHVYTPYGYIGSDNQLLIHHNVDNVCFYVLSKVMVFVTYFDPPFFTVRVV